MLALESCLQALNALFFINFFTIWSFLYETRREPEAPYAAGETGTS